MPRHLATRLWARRETTSASHEVVALAGAAPLGTGSVKAIHQVGEGIAQIGLLIDAVPRDLRWSRSTRTLSPEADRLVERLREVLGAEVLRPLPDLLRTLGRRKPRDA